MTKLGFDRSFTIYDTDDTKRLLKDILKELELDEKTFPVREIQTIISRSKDDMILPEEFAAQAEKSQDWRRKRIGKVYALYNQKLRDANALDFDDIILHTVDLLRTDRERWPTTSASSATSSSTSIRTPTIYSICWPVCWQGDTATSAW